MRVLITAQFILGTALLAQPSFDVASVKAGGDVLSTRPERSGGRIRWTTQLCYLIGYAYDLDFSRVTGHACGAVYSLDATFDPAASEQQLRQMVQSLLAARFNLRAHRVTTQVEGYAMTLGKGGLKIAAAKDDDPPELRDQSFVSTTLPDAGIAEVTARRASMAQLAKELSRVNRATFWDRTGLSGQYSVKFRYLQDLSADSKSDAPSLGTALQESLGIKLEKQKGPLETLVIDQLEPPGDN